MKKKIIKATKEGKLYIPTEDFFKQSAVKKILEKAKRSKLVQDIIKNTKSW